ncbi:MAG TPA: ABC transporter permease [Dehalococcoidia bacterium]|nr:ABC transporter permease [Dehalococcoidia bacterium]
MSGFAPVANREPTAGMGSPERGSDRPRLRPYARAMYLSFRQRVKEQLRIGFIIGPIVGSTGPAVTLAWAAGRGDNPEATSYVFIGFSLYTMWLMGIAMIGWSLTSEAWAGTLDLMMTTRTPLPLIMLGKALGLIAYISIPATYAFFVVLLVGGRTPSIDSVPLLVIAVVLAVVALVATHFLFAPLAFISGTTAGFISSLMPLGGVITGFLFPTGLLPAPLDVFAQGLPTSWAMSAIVRSIEGGAFVDVLADWGIALALCAVYAVATVALFVVAERRVRRRGNLGTL